MDLNSVFITLGVAVILVLITALVGPFFVDWTVYRSTFEKYAERVLGHNVTVLGDADIRLLPSPAVTFTDVRVGEAEDPLLVVSRFQMRIELPPLMKGEVRVLDMEMERPHLSLSLDENGRLDWLTAITTDGVLAALPAEDVAFERISITDGAVSIIDARSGQTHRFDDGNLQVSARTLDGPFRVDGSLTYDGKPYSVQLATGRKRPEGGIRVKGQVTPSNWPLNVAFDGMLAHEDAAPGFAGTFDLESIQDDSEADKAWRADGEFSVDVSRLAIPTFEYRHGPEDKLFGLDGEAEIVHSGERRFEIRARSKQVDLDRLFGGGPQAPVSFDDAAPKLIATLKRVPIPDMSGVVALDFPAVVMGGSLAQDVRLDLETTLGGWRIARLAGRAPGRTIVATQGDLAIHPELTYRGSVSVATEQPGVFAAWWRQSGKGSSAIQPVSVEGRLNVVPTGAALDNLRLELAGAEATGALSYRKPKSGNAVFSLSLDADKLDLDQIETLAGIFERPDDGLKDLDVSLRVLAREISIRELDGKGLALEAEYSNNGLRIDRLYAEDLAGAELDVGGRVDNILTAPEGLLSGTLNAENLTGLVALTSSLLPESAILDRLERAASFLVPAKFQAELQASARDGISEAKFQLTGNAGGATTEIGIGFNGRVDEWRKAEIALGLTLEGPDGGQILRQLGFDILPVGELGAGKLNLTTNGKAEDGLEIVLDASTGQGKIGIDGQLQLQEGEEPDYRFAVSASAPDVSPFALLAGRVLPVMAGNIDADLVFNLAGQGTKFTVDGLQGTVAGVALDGQIFGDMVPVPGETNRRVKGKMRLGSLDLRFLSEAILGPDQWFSAGDGSSIWPNGPFGAPLFDSTDLTLDLQTDRLIIDEVNVVRGVRSELRLTPMMMRLDGLNGVYASGKLNGTMAIRRSGAEGAVSGTLKLEDAALRDLIWLRDSRPVATGTLDLFLEYEGAGRSISGLVAGLSGGGTFSVEKGELRGINPQAFPLVMRAVDAGLELEDDRIREVFVSHMGAGNLDFQKMEGAVTLIGGRLSARNIVVDSERADLFGSAEINLNSWTLEGDFSMEVDPGENAVTGAEPQVGMLFSGPVDTPLRSIDIAPFSAFLTLRAFEQEVERVEKLQAEILERDRLLREMKRQKQDRERRKREAEEAAEAARLAAEAAAQAEADAQNNANETPAANGADTESAPVEQDQSQAPVPPSPAENPRASASTGSTDFADRIRALIDENDSATGGPLVLQPADPVTQSGGTGDDVELKPLGPPRVIEDLLAREIGIPAHLLDAAPDPLINGGVRR